MDKNITYNAFNKITVMIDSQNQVYAYARCNIVKEGDAYFFAPSLIMNEESIKTGCKMIIIDEYQIPENCELWQCKFDNGKVFYCEEKVEFAELSCLRVEREEEFKIADKYQLPQLQSTLTEEQKNEYNTWRQAWLDVTETKVKPDRPIWFSV